MSSTTVYGCDWCKEIVEKDRKTGEPEFSMKVTAQDLHLGLNNTTVDDICSDCRKAFQALREGKFRRG